MGLGGFGSVGSVGNARVQSKYGWAVGDVAWLDSQASHVRAYWREIESGTKRFVGRRISGLWGGPGGGGTGGLHAFGQGNRSAQTLVPFSRDWGKGNANTENIDRGARNAAIFLAKNGQRSKGDRSQARGKKNSGHGPTAGVINKPITAHRMFLEASTGFNPADAERRALAEAFKGITIGGSKPTRAGVNRGLGEPANGNKRIPVQFSKAQLGKLVGGIGTSASGAAGGGGVLAFGTTTGGGSQGLDRNAKGNVTEAQKQLIRANATIAREYAMLVAAQLERTRVRKGISTNRLRTAILSPRNRWPQTPARSG